MRILPQKTTIINQQKIFKDHPEWYQLKNRTGVFEMYWDILDEFSKGFMYLIKLRPDLMLSINDCCFREDIRTFFEHKNPLFTIDFTFSGNAECVFDYGDGSRSAYVFEPEQGCIAYRPEYQCLTSFRDKKPLRSLGIYITPSLLKDFIGEQYDYIPTGMHDIMDGNNEQRYCHSLITTVAIKTAIHEIFNCPYQGNLKRLWLESKTLELIAHSLAQLGANKDQPSKVFTLHPRNVGCILNAKDILIDDIGTPPSLLELANMVGINKNKLNQDFREVFGTSVFDYLRICRLKRAKELLKSGEKNVTEVALEVGYTQQSSFTKAFKRYFGTYPSNYLR